VKVEGVLVNVYAKIIKLLMKSCMCRCVGPLLAQCHVTALQNCVVRFNVLSTKIAEYYHCFKLTLHYVPSVYMHYTRGIPLLLSLVTWLLGLLLIFLTQSGAIHTFYTKIIYQYKATHLWNSLQSDIECHTFHDCGKNYFL